MAMAVGAWPQLERVKAMPIARNMDGLRDLKRTVPLDAFRERAHVSRNHTDSWTLSSTLTDLVVDLAEDTATHGDLDPGAPKGTTLHDRFAMCFERVRSPTEDVPATLRGHGRRVQANGLGFDVTRISGLADSSKKLVDPVIEVLAFFGLKALPTRGPGIEVTSGGGSRRAVRQRGWRSEPSQSSWHRSMTWPAWAQPLDLHGVDALLDQWSNLNQRAPRERRSSRNERLLLGIHAAWETRSYKKRAKDEVVSGLASARIELDARRR